MPKNRHLFLDNKSNKNNRFKKTRYVPTPQATEETDVEQSKLPSIKQQARLKNSLSDFRQDKVFREASRSIDVPAHIDLIKIHFYKVFNKELEKVFFEKYDLLVVTYENFNKTVLFEIRGGQPFDLFIQHLEAFFNSPTQETYQGKAYSHIALIHDFEFLSTTKRVHSNNQKISGLNLIPIQTASSGQIYRSLIQYLQDKQKELLKSDLDTEFIEVYDLSQNEIIEIADNFDIIKSIISSRTERIRPGEYSQVRRDYGFTVTCPANAPIIGVIDTGVNRIDPLKSCITNIAYDLTDTSAYWDENGHGTSVAGLITLGQEFILNIKTVYEAKAKIAIIKALHDNVGEINIIKLLGYIKEARRNHNIKFFNLSINERLHKSYNSTFSNYAYQLDKLTYEEDILIFISVGNISAEVLEELIKQEPHNSHKYPKIFYCLGEESDIHCCETTNICPPSESLNNLSIGAIASNLEDGLTSDITPAEEYPAYYTRKFHYDYDQSINGHKLSKNQKNKNLNKPDLVFAGGDLFKVDSGIEILRSPIDDHNKFFSRSCGTSLATPLIASLGAELIQNYPELRPQTIKALLINSAKSPCGKNPLFFRGHKADLPKKLLGFGKPLYANLVFSDENAVTFIIESQIGLEELETIKIVLPEFINRSGNKLNFNATLCFNFLPIKDNHLNYLPLQITFGIFKPQDASTISGSNSESYKIKPAISWSEDFFGIENRLLSNVQRIDFNLSGVDIERLHNEVTLAVKCTGKKEIPTIHRGHLENNQHKFSLILTITETPTSRVSNRLYNDITAVNTIKAIAEAEGEAFAEIE